MTPQVKAAVTEGLKLAGMFRQNAALKHGIPGEWEPTELDSQEQPKPPEKTPDLVVTQPSPGVPQPPALLGLSRRALVGWALAGGTALTGIGGTVGYLLNRPAVESPAEPSGSLLQWLEDTGQHVPERKP